MLFHKFFIQIYMDKLFLYLDNIYNIKINKENCAKNIDGVININNNVNFFNLF